MLHKFTSYWRGKKAKLFKWRYINAGLAGGVLLALAYFAGFQHASYRLKVETTRPPPALPSEAWTTLKEEFLFVLAKTIKPPSCSEAWMTLKEESLCVPAKTIKPPAQLSKVWSIVEAKFVDQAKIVPQEMWYGAIKGLVQSLGDPHSKFFDPTESAEVLALLEGKRTGIGAEILLHEKVLTVVSPHRGSPAERAGLLPGDQIIKIEGEDVKLPPFEGSQRIRGPIGTKVELTIRRAGESEPRVITITRELIEIESVTVEFPSENLALLTIRNFDKDVVQEFQQVVADLQDRKLAGLILDLRFNDGGLLEAAVEITSSFLAAGEVVLIEERDQPLQRIAVTGDVKFPEIPLAVLINGRSASAAEVVAGALQAAGRAQIFGEQSFGKGTSQVVVEDFADGSILKITIGKCRTPAGHSIEGIGITPDVPVELDFVEFLAGQDQQLQAALEWLQQP